MSYFKSIPPRPNCIYCGNPVADEAWDEESHGWFSYGPNCMLSHPQGRYGVKMIDGSLVVLYSVRVTTKLRAEMMADYLKKSNPQHEGRVTYEAVDLGKGITNECRTNNH